MITDWTPSKFNDDKMQAYYSKRGTELRIKLTQKLKCFTPSGIVFSFDRLTPYDCSGSMCGAWAIIGWPSFFPILNRRILYDVRYEVKEGSANG